MKSTSRVKNTQTIVVIGMLDSIHVARWMNSVKHLPYRYILFPSSPHRRIHPSLKTLINSKSEVSELHLSIFLRALALPLWILDRFFANRLRALILRKCIRSSGASLVHAIELQSAGYVSRRACVNLDVPLYVTNWGSDIYWFSRFKKHESELKKLMKRANYYSAECHRDHDLATAMGFTGTFFPVVPNAGGIEQDLLDELAITPTSERRVVLIKGYTNFVGRADIALDAVRLLGSEIAGYEVVVYSATLKAQQLVRRIRKTTEINIRSIPKKKLSHREMIALFSSARVYVGVSESDGISTSMLEAMATGCFPIQTTTACVDEWIEDGVSGLFIADIDANSIAELLVKALSDDSLVDSAATINQVSASKKLDQTVISKVVSEYYPVILRNAAVA
jgi:glycosyltransferase involved in cell wall biosynthesis